MAFDPRNPLDRMERRYHDGLKGVAITLWQGSINLASSGFGKGVLLAAAFALCFSGIAAVVSGSAFLAGAGQALTFLGSGAGIGLMAAGGIIGAVSDTHPKPDLVRAETQAKRYARARGQEPGQSCVHGCNNHFTQAELERRKHAATRSRQ